jgi:hypothetical protein
VEVCRVLADSPKASLKALDALKKRIALAERNERMLHGSAKLEDMNEWSGDEVEEDTEGEEDEWKYESGEEGKKEGRWAGRKRIKRD